MQRYSRLTIAIALLALIFLLIQFFFLPAQIAKTRFGQALQFPKILISGIGTKVSLIRNLSALQLENQSLEARITKLKTDPNILSDERGEYLRVSTYSRYPFNNTNQILINAGSEQEVKKGNTVLIQPGIFLGTIVELSKNHSVVRTIFDLNWELSVKIGEEKVDGLFIGGRKPKVTLVSQKQKIEKGDAITLASTDFPLGLTIGLVDEVSRDREELFQELSIKFAYIPTEIKQVFISD